MKKLGFGLMRLPLTDINDNGSIDIEKTRQMIDKYMSEGFTYFDTAYVYHRGNSEKVFGQLVADRYPRDSYVLTTKMPCFIIKAEEEYEKIFQKQLERCKVEYFDNYFLHAIGKKEYENISKMHGFEFLIRKKSEGKIKHIGFSFHDDAEFLDKILNEHPETEVVQIQLNYLDWDSESIQSRKCYEVCRKHGVKIAVMEPLKGGSLANLNENSAKKLKDASPEKSLASWGIRFAASLEDVFVVLSGMSNEEQLFDNISYMKDFQPLTDFEYSTIEKTVKIINDSIAVQCTGCHYCTDGCPANIAIPEFFALYNDQKQFKLLPGLEVTFSNIIKGRGKPSDCIECGQCEDKCPQHLDIIQNLKEVSKVFE